MNRQNLADHILAQLEQEKFSIMDSYNKSKDSIGHFFIDNLLPGEIANSIYASFPKPKSMKKRKDLRELKYVAAQMNQYDPILEEVVFAFQDERIVSFIRGIFEIDSLYPDEHLYAGGISSMDKGHFLNPHLDNSHDKDRNKWRVLNLLYYVTPNWELDFGGNLEIWPRGVKNEQTTIHSKFNRLVVMATHDASWHSVSPVTHEGSRCCVSNYYFSDSPLKANEQFHVTSFRGRPSQKIRDLYLRFDTSLRMGIRKVFSKGIVETDHLYKKPEQ